MTTRRSGELCSCLASWKVDFSLLIASPFSLFYCVGNVHSNNVEFGVLYFLCVRFFFFFYLSQEERHEMPMGKLESRIHSSFLLLYSSFLHDFLIATDRSRYPVILIRSTVDPPQSGTFDLRVLFPATTARVESYRRWHRRPFRQLRRAWFAGAGSRR